MSERSEKVGNIQILGIENSGYNFSEDERVIYLTNIVNFNEEINNHY